MWTFSLKRYKNLNPTEIQRKPKERPTEIQREHKDIVRNETYRILGKSPEDSAELFETGEDHP